MSFLAALPSMSGSLSSRARVSFPCLASPSRSCTVSVRSNGWRCSDGRVGVRLRATAMAEVVDDKEDLSVSEAAAARRTAVLASSSGGDAKAGHCSVFMDAGSHEELVSGIRKVAEAGRIPPNVAAAMEELYHNYKHAVLQSGNPKANEIILSNMAVVLDRILLEVEDPFSFSAYHKAMREPFDYYMFGQNYIRPLIDFRRSYVGNLPLFYDIEEKIQQGHNVILISNHQTEADPAIIALLLERTNPHLAEKITYVAGDRVVTDPLCKPFSMGRNLLCVYSKKHMGDDPELVEKKRKANTRSLKEMAFLLRNGAQIIWIAPSGGRDRPDPVSGEGFPAPFDASSVDNIRRLTEHSSVPGHLYPLALLCSDVMPPPPQVEKQIGERRMISYHGVGLSVASEMNFKTIASGLDNPEEAKSAFSLALYDSVCEQYNVLKSAIYGNKGLSASNTAVSLSKPWE
ncbi:hypothetical protein QJS10_CPA01g02960 [Acorus calamus]|uniref:Glycerol-3-phosphate acyltransferase, chloroplastic n=1 Tax=Acorus calamus TaxID=4465 RepID=A0AAV9FNB3_ACOCL|nr:hypothetical protein QJS10_CPA01g02960 [Acorus calamus]